MTKRAMVAPRASDCRICRELTPIQAAEVNAAIWPEPGIALRSRGYRVQATRAAAVYGCEVEVKTITRHAEHIEHSWRKLTNGSPPPTSGERPVFPTDFQSVATRYAGLGMAAADAIEERLPELEPRELVQVARMGLSAATAREAMRLKAQEVDTAQGMLAAIFGLAGDHLSEGDIPDTEVIDVTPVEVLHAEIEEEREALRQLQAGARA